MSKSHRLPRFKKTKRTTAYFFMSLNTLVWGAALVLVKPAFSITTPFRFLLYRYILASLLAIPIIWHFWPHIKKRRQVLTKITLIEILGGPIALSLLYSGLSLTSAIETSLITTTTPIFVSLMAVAWLKEKEEGHELLGLGIAFIGTLVLTLLPLLKGYAQLENLSLTGNLLVMGQNIVTALYFVLAKKHYQRLPKFFVAAASFYVCLLLFAPLSAIQAGGVKPLLALIQQDLQHTSVWFASGYMAIFGSVIGYAAYLKGQEGLEASEATLFTYLQPLVYLPLGLWLLSEPVNPLQLISLLIIFIGVVVAEKRR